MREYLVEYIVFHKPDILEETRSFYCVAATQESAIAQLRHWNGQECVVTNVKILDPERYWEM